MKIRTDFVSNSSSSSFMVYLDEKHDIDKYIALFDELLKESIQSDKLFEYIVIDVVKLQKEDQDLANELRQGSPEGYDTWGMNLLDDYNMNHGLDIDTVDLGVVEFTEFLFIYMNSAKKELLKSVIKMFITERCWENSPWSREDYCEELQNFLESKTIRLATSSACV